MTNGRDEKDLLITLEWSMNLSILNLGIIKISMIEILSSVTSLTSGHGLFFKSLLAKLFVAKYWFEFQAWPEDALELVANKFLDDVEMTQHIREQTVVLCKHFHQGVRALSDRYSVERHYRL